MISRNYSNLLSKISFVSTLYAKHQKKLLILIVAYNAEKHINAVMDRIPDTLWESPLYDTEVLILDDASHDNTAAVCQSHSITHNKPVTIIRNPVNLGYGGNQKSGYHYAIQHGFDIVALLHGDGQYAPEILPELIMLIIEDKADAVFGSRMIEKQQARKGGMPLYKFAGNIILSHLQNWLLSSHLSEYHSGYRVYSLAALKQLPFSYNSDWFDFDTDIIIQLIDNKMRIYELPIPTYYGDEICHVNGIRYALLILANTVLSRLQKKGLAYRRRYDYHVSPYSDKTAFCSSHSFALTHIPAHSRVMDLGGGNGHVAEKLESLGCRVDGCDLYATDISSYDHYIQADLNHMDFGIVQGTYDVVLLADIIEHLDSPEHFMEKLRQAPAFSQAIFIITVPNVAFISIRLLLLFGQFNYAEKGIMDKTHKRFFTFSSLKRLLKDADFTIEKTTGIPAPFPLVVGDNVIGRLCLTLNRLLISLWKSLFSYQIGVVVRPIGFQNVGIIREE